MKCDVIVIIACEKLCNNLRYLGLLDYQKAHTIDYVGFYLCGAANKDDISVFIKNLLNREEYSEIQKDKIRKLLSFIGNTNAKPIDEDFKLFIARNMWQLDSNSWKCMPMLMENERYLVLPIAESV